MGDSNNRSPRIGQIEPRVADLQKERGIPRLSDGVCAYFRVFLRGEIRPTKSHDDDDDEHTVRTTPERGKNEANNFAKRRSPRMNGGSTKSL